MYTEDKIENFSKLFNYLPFGVAFLRIDGYTLNFNQKASQIFEKSEKELERKSVTELFPLSKKRKLNLFIKTSFASKSSCSSVFQRVKGGRDQFIRIVTTFHPLNFEKKGLLLIFEDVTKEILLQQRHQEVEKRLSDVGHDLKTPLTNIKLFAQLLKKLSEKNDDSEFELYLSKIDAQSDKLTMLINDFLDFAKGKDKARC